VPTNDLNFYLFFFPTPERIIPSVSLREVHSFLCVPKEKKRRVVCATPLRKGSPAAETAPIAGVQNRQGEQRVGLTNRRSLRSNSLPLLPVVHPTHRFSADGFSCPRMFNGGFMYSSAGWTWSLAGSWVGLIVPTLKPGRVGTAVRPHQQFEFLIVFLLNS
jgi:hypothetical protein